MAALQPVPQARRVGVISHQAPVRQCQDEVVDLGTPETRRRIVHDPLLRMLENDQIDQDQYNSAILIAKGWQLITIGLDAQIATYGMRIPGGNGDAPAEYATVLIRQYHTWIKEVQDREQAAGRFMHGARRSRVPAIMDVIVHGFTCKYVQRCRRMKNGNLIVYVKEALDVYTDIRFGRGKWRQQKAA